VKSTKIERLQSENVELTQSTARRAKDPKATKTRRTLIQREILLSGGLPRRAVFSSLVGDDTRADLPNGDNLLSQWKARCQQIPQTLFGDDSIAKQRTTMFFCLSTSKA